MEMQVKKPQDVPDGVREISILHWLAVPLPKILRVSPQPVTHRHCHVA
jgi:hypothetical protein